MARIERPEIHAKALAERVPLGRIKTGRELGYANGQKFVWDACPVCSRRRWVRLLEKGIWCARCAAKRAGRYAAFLKGADAARARLAHFYALGKAADAAGLTVERIKAMGRGEREDGA